MPAPEIIKTLKKASEKTYKEKGSKFIARSFPVRSEKDVLTFLEEIKKLNYDASHHCFAFRLKDGSFRYSDAGEPSGTAGIRILNAIDHFDIKDILIIVTRYFGGTKLGVGPLGKAYSTSSELLLKGCVFQEERHFSRLIITTDFSFISLVHRELSNHSAIIENIDYSQEVIFKTLIPPEDAETLKSALIDNSKGNIEIKTDSEIIYHII